ncbi:MAG TPA: amino acid adenylation domain-containing protein, partial [Streptosporangiaceae bacterium]
MLTDSQRAALAVRLRRSRTETGSSEPVSLKRRDPHLADLPLSFGQEQLWILDRLAPGQAMYNIPIAISLDGALDVDALQAVLDALAQRHEALRTRLVASNGRPVQRIDLPRPVPITTVDLSAEPSDDQLQGFIDTEALRPFDLAAGPLMRASLIRLGTGRHILLQIFHHAIFDGWSANVLLRELAALYRQCSSGESSGLTDLPVQFADYALWERARLDGVTPNGARPDGARPEDARAGESARYWREVMDGFETVRFPADRPRPLVEDWAGDLAVLMTDPGLLADLRELSRRQESTLFVTLMAGLQALLYRYTGQTDLVVGTVSANRARPELASLIGFLVNTLPIRTDSGGDPSFAELMARVKRATTGAYAHQDLPFGKIVETLSVPRDPGRAPVFQIALAYAERDLAPIEAAGVRFTLTDLVAGVRSAKFDLSFLAEARPGGLWFECSYKTSLFDEGRITRLLGHLEVLLRGAAANPEARLSELPLLTEAELRRELVDWNDTARPYPTGCVHELFEAQALRTPDAVAAEFGAEQLSYAELDARANKIAWRLRELGVGPESLVGVCMATGLTRLAVFFGVWKAGGGYVPLDPGLPRDRLSYLIADTGMGLIVADSTCAEALPDSAASVVRLDDDPPAARGPEAGPPTDVGVSPANVAYVIYTSGSTGQPKGVVVEHRHVVNFIHGTVEPWQIGPSDAVLQFSACTFDVSVMDTYVALACGARVVLADPETLHTPRRLIALMRERKVTCVFMTPSVASLLGEGPFPHLRVLLCGGEEMPVELALRWRDRPGVHFINGYGPTEVTVIATYQEHKSDFPLPPSIGFPAANYTAYLLDDHLNPVPVGVIGDLHLGGASVARGYLNRPELTAARFIDDPFAANGGRMYKSGDLCYRRPDGSLVSVGRVDHQVKLRGLRIELGEIETTLTAHPQIDQAVVLVTTGPAGDKDLTAYLCPAVGETPDVAEVRAHLAAKLPAYMVPAQFVTLAEFPLNVNGKVDRRALRAPAYPATGNLTEPIDSATSDVPATPTEAVLTRLFGTVLNRPPISPAANFFDSGGNSLQVMRLIDLIADETQADLTPTAVFLHPTPRELAAHVDTTAQLNNSTNSGVAIPPATPAGLTLLSAA